MGNFAKSIAKITLPIALASSVSGCAGFPKPMVDDLGGAPAELSYSDALGKAQRRLAEDLLEGRTKSTFPFSFEESGERSVLAVSGVRTGKNGQVIDGISSWKGEGLSWVLGPYTESMFLRISFREDITFENAYYVGSQLHNGLWPSMSKRYGGWTTTCEEFMPIRNRTTNMVRAIESFCHRKIPKKEKK